MELCGKLVAVWFVIPVQVLQVGQERHSGVTEDWSDRVPKKTNQSTEVQDWWARWLAWSRTADNQNWNNCCWIHLGEDNDKGNGPEQGQQFSLIGSKFQIFSQVSTTIKSDKGYFEWYYLGEYVIGFRWDFEKTSQEWSSYADITIVCRYLIIENIKLSKFTFLTTFIGQKILIYNCNLL